MLSRRAVLVTLAISGFFPRFAAAAERLPYTSEVFAQALKAGKPILVHVTAPWCGECKLQKPIVARVSAQPDFERVLLFDVDFDSQKVALRDLHVRMQSTLLAFKDGMEVGRLVGDTRAAPIESLMRRVL